jgi:hypothetical protein
MLRVALLLVGVLAAEVSPVQKVIQLLEELKGKVASDLEADSKLMDEYEAWCDEEANAKEDSITSSKRTISDLGATIADAKATILSLTSSIDELSKKVASKEAELAKSKSIREEEHAVFIASEKELADTVDSLERAGTVVKNNLGLVQGRVATAVQAMASGLHKVIEASWVNDHERSVVQSLLQAAESDGDEQQPVAFASSSGGIVDTLADMKDKAEESLSSTRKGEMEAAHAYALLKQGIEDVLEVSKKQLTDDSLMRSTTEEELHEAEASLAETKKVLATDEAYLAELKQSCEAKAVQWSARKKSAAEEMAAIETAKTTLSDGVPSFVQTGARVQVRASADSEEEVRDKAAKLLRGLAHKANSYALAQLAIRVRSDPFGKVRGLIEEMISKLVKAAAEEADQKQFCDEETSESKAKQADLSGKLEKTAARIQKAEAGKAKLTEEIKHLSSEIAEIDAGQAEATSVRGEQHEEFLKASQDAKDSAAAVAKAIDVLSEYYSKAASFVQVGSATHAWQPAFGAAKSDVGSTIVSILENCESNFAQMLAEQEADESSALESYETLTQDNKVAKAEKTADVDGKEAELKHLEVAVGNYKENKATTTEELDAVLTYLDKLKPQCETKALSYAERKAKRDAEIGGLKEALTLLSGEAFFQTSLRGARRV